MASTERRRCGSCTLCCKLLPVPSVGKPAGRRCPHQRFAKGCAIYAERPEPCRLWYCLWLSGNAIGAGLRRPDRSGFVVDIMPEFVRARDNRSGAIRKQPVDQIWADPKRIADILEDPTLRAYVERRSAQGVWCLVRTSKREGFVLMFEDGRAQLIASGFEAEPEHSAAEVAEAWRESGGI